MDWQADWERIKTRLLALWDGQMVDRCCVALKAPKDGLGPSPKLPPPANEEERYYDRNRVLQGWIGRIDRTAYLGDALPLIWSNYGTAGHAKYAPKAKCVFRRDTVWYEPVIEDITEDFVYYDPASPMLQKELELTKHLCGQTMGRAMVSFPDNCGILDSLAHLRGSEGLLIDMLTEPEAVLAAAQKLTQGFLDSARQFFGIIKENNLGGSTHGWMNTWDYGPHGQLQADISVMISPAMYERFVLPELVALSDFYDHSVYHLDGSAQVRHLDILLSVKRINMVQWTHVAGEPPMSHFLDPLRRIQKAGKGLVLITEKEEVPKLLDGLRPEGLLLIVNDAATVSEAREILDYVTKRTAVGTQV